MYYNKISSPAVIISLKVRLGTHNGMKGKNKTLGTGYGMENILHLKIIQDELYSNSRYNSARDS